MADHYRTGSLFSIQLSNSEFLTGRVLLDVDGNGNRRGLVPKHSGIDFMRDTILIEIYERISDEPSVSISEALLQGILVWPEPITENEWPLVGFEEVDQRDIEFPEGFTSIENSMVLQRGEVSLPVSLNREQLDEVAPETGIQAWGMVRYFALYEFGRKDEIAIPRLTEDDNSSISRGDLRFSENRDFVWDHVNVSRDVDRDQPYYDFALYHGWDTRRFFVALTDSGDIILCPYCQTAMNPGEQDCPHCERDTTNDASIQLTPEQYCATKRQSCTHCAAQLIEGSVACWSCTQWQS